MHSFKIEVKENTYNGKSYFTLVEKSYIFKIRVYKEEYKKKFYTLEEAQRAADNMYYRLVEEVSTSSKTVWEING